MEKRIQLLPKVLQDLISEYNVHHRKNMRTVLQEYLNMIYTPCRMCQAPFDAEFCPIDYFIIHKFNLYCHWCSVDCFHEDQDAELKLKCLTVVDDYVKKKDKKVRLNPTI